MSVRIVLAQLGSTDDKQLNLQKARDAIGKSVDVYGSDMVVFPEVYMSHFPAGTPHDVVKADSEPLDGRFVTSMCELAQKHNTWLVFGMRESTEDADDDRVYNTTVMVDSNGSIVGSYRKTHLYDAFGAKESEHIKPGDHLFDPVDTPSERLVCSSAMNFDSRKSLAIKPYRGLTSLSSLLVGSVALSRNTIGRHSLLRERWRIRYLSLLVIKSVIITVAIVWLWIQWVYTWQPDRKSKP
ncbi:hypothetical protein GCM10025859_33570 [Alicyclobacillus fastidiosus]|nr:hypothetical protein GCM10025859_33570 [Alicyclobacillus fastidiosus]